ncbi:hypothetical protein [Treponema sp. R6D11]
MDEELWESAVKFWLSKCFSINNPSKRQLEITDTYLNSMNVEKDDVISFCKSTGWKYGHAS